MASGVARRFSSQLHSDIQSCDDMTGYDEGFFQGFGLPNPRRALPDD